MVQMLDLRLHFFHLNSKVLDLEIWLRLDLIHLNRFLVQLLLQLGDHFFRYRWVFDSSRYQLYLRILNWV